VIKTASWIERRVALPKQIRDRLHRSADGQSCVGRYRDGGSSLGAVERARVALLKGGFGATSRARDDRQQDV
jgi:hypothetical protein